MTTLHGPFLEGRCNDCGAIAMVVAPELLDDGTTLVPVFHGTPRCSTCGRRHHGLPPY